MIESSFTQIQRIVTPSDKDLDEFPQCHKHCFRCRNAQCKHPVDNRTSCLMTSCTACGWRFHQCKAEEHTLTCPEEQVPCINVKFGCPHSVKREDMSSHLPVCPASVLCCGVQWHRFPMYAHEQEQKHPVPSNNVYAECGQLDTALAMKDQRTLIDSLRAPNKQSEKNSLTKKYPANPVHQGSSLESDLAASADAPQTVFDGETDAQWNLNWSQPGLITKLVLLSRAKTESLEVTLNEANNSNTDGESQNIIRSLRSQDGTQNALTKASGYVGKNRIHDTYERHNSSSKEGSHAKSLQSDVSSERFTGRSRPQSVLVLHDVGGSQLEKSLGIKIGDKSYDNDKICLHDILGVSVMNQSIYHWGEESMHTFICAQNFRRDQYRWHFKNIHEDIIPNLDGYLEHRCPLANMGCTFSFQRLKPSQPDRELHFSWLQESFGLKSLSHPFPPTNTTESDIKKSFSDTTNNTTKSSDPSLSTLGDVDPQFDSIALSDKTTAAPVLSPELQDKANENERKDLLNVKPVLYTGVNPDSKVLFVYNVEEEVKQPTSCGLNDLPTEVLEYIARHLDSFSLCNLSLTSRLLRQVCCNLLDDLGIVLLNWKQQKVGDKVSWQVANKRWIFSTSFEPIKSWKINEDHMTISDHLKICPFNQDKLQHDVSIPMPNDKDIMQMAMQLEHVELN